MAAMHSPLLHLHMMNGGNTLRLPVSFPNVEHVLRDLLTMLFHQFISILGILFPVSPPEPVPYPWFMNLLAAILASIIPWVPVHP
jgi:hypothetical protein